MRFIASILILLLFSLVGFSQQIPLSNLYTTNLHHVNPAFAAVADYNSAILSHRNQWSRLNNNPQTTFLSTNYSLLENSAISGVLSYDRIGVMRHMHAKANFSHAVPLNEDHKVAFSIGLGVNQSKIDLNTIIAEDYTDEVLLNASNSGLTYLTDLGVLYHNKNMTFGISSPNIVPGEVTNGSLNYAMARHYNFLASYSIQYNQLIIIQPSILYRSANLTSSQFDMNIDVHWGRTSMLGVGYRNKTSLLARANMFVNKKIQVGYSLDIFVGKSRRSLLAHELLIAYKIFKTPEAKDLPENNLDTTATTRSDSAFLVFKNEEDSILKYKFVNIDALKDFAINHKKKDYTINYLVNQELAEDPDIHTFNLLQAQDSLYTVEIEDSSGHVKKHRFITLAELHDFENNMARDNPILSAKLKKQIDIHPDEKVFHIVKPSFDSYSVEVYDSTTQKKKKFKFQTVDQLNDFLIQTKQNDSQLYQKMLAQIYDDPEANIFPVTDNSAELNNNETLTASNNNSNEQIKTSTTGGKEVNGNNETASVALSKENKNINPDNEELIVEKLNSISKEIKLEFNLNAVNLDQTVQERELKLIADLAQEANVTVKLIGHTCDIGSVECNLRIGKKRAEYVKSLLVKYGLSPNKISTQTKGESQPIATNISERSRTKNRRVELRIENN